MRSFFIQKIQQASRGLGGVGEGESNIASGKGDESKVVTALCFRLFFCFVFCNKTRSGKKVVHSNYRWNEIFGPY